MLEFDLDLEQRRVCSRLRWKEATILGLKVTIVVGCGSGWSRICGKCAVVD